MALKTPEKNEEETGLQPSSIPAEQLERIPTASQEDIDQLRAGHTKPGPDGTANNGSSYINDGGVKFNDTSYDPTRFKPNETRGVYDGETNPLKDKEQGTYGKQLSGKDLKNKEEQGSSESGDASTDEEKAKLENKSGLFSGNEEQSTFGKFRAKITGTSRKKTTLVVVTGVVVLGGAGGFSLLQGPFQFIMVSQLLQQYFLRANENFGNDRSQRTFLYALAGQAERGRLGTISNAYADKMEKKLLEKNGVKPIFYDNKRSRIAGYELVDEGLARRSGFLKSVQDAVPGSDVKQVNMVGGSLGIKGSKGAKISPTARILHYPAGTPAKDIRKATQAATKAMGLNKVSTAMVTRVSVARVGAKLHYLNGLREKRDRAADLGQKTLSAEERSRSREIFEQTFNEQREAEIKNGTITAKLSGKAKELNDQINEATKGQSKAAAKITRSALIKGAGPAAVVGILCSANDIGDSAEDAKYINNALPLMRNFWYFTSAGEQAKTGHQISLDELSVLQKTLYDKETGTHVLQAAPLVAEAGGTPSKSAPDVPIEARVNNLGGKPDAFEAIEKVLDFGIEIRLLPDIKLSQGCTVIDVVSNLPGVSQFSDLIGKGIDGILSVAGTSTDELFAGLISVINGDSVDITAVGGEAGALLAMGGKLSSIDQGLALGASQLSTAQAYKLKEEQRLADIENNKNKSLAERYLNPYESSSLTGKLAMALPANSTDFSDNLSDPTESFASLFSSLFTPIESKATAATNYDYGVSDYGYSIDDQDDERFEDPYNNASIVEPELESLNEKYSKCFGIKIIPDGESVKIETSQVNILKLEKDEEFKDCRNDTEKEEFKRYKFYIADTMSALALACFEEDQESCDKLNGSTQDGADSPEVFTEPPDEINGYTLTENEKKHLKYIAENVVTKLEGSREDQAKMAAESAWWALREAVLNLDNPFTYSNCGTGDGNTPIGPAELCPSGVAWQVGIGAVQVPNFSSGIVKNTTTKLNQGETEGSILGSVAKLGGFSEGSSTYNAIVGSSGDVRKSLLMRDPATGMTLVNQNVRSECLKASGLPSWCTSGSARAAITSTPENIKKAIAELESYFMGSTGAVSDTATGGSGVVGNIAQSSTEVPCAPNTKDIGIYDGYTGGTLVKIRLCAVSNLESGGQESNGGYGVTGGGGKAVVNSRVSGAFYKLVEAAKRDGIALSATSSFRSMEHQQYLCNNDSQCRSGDNTAVAKPGYSNHQLGVAVDFSLGLDNTRSNCITIGGKCTARGYPAWEWLDKNAVKFGLKQYVNEFWHFSPDGR